MKRLFAGSAASLLLFLAPLVANASITIDESGGITHNPDISAAGTPVQAVVTCYGPGGGGIQGGFSTSRPSLIPTDGSNPLQLTKPGPSIPFTLDDVRLGKSKYVTLASNPSNYNKWYKIGTVDYISIMDGKEYVLENVVGYVHDTGDAFQQGTCAKYNTCGVIDRKFDVAYGDFRNGGGLGAIYKSKFCQRMNQTWLQVGGQVDMPGTTVQGPYSYGGAVPLGTPTGQTNGSYCITSIDPLIVQPLPAGSVIPSNCYNSSAQQIAQRPPPPPQPPQQQQQMQQQAQSQRPTSLLNQISQIFNPKPAPTPILQPSAILLVQPTRVVRGNPIVVSWSSVGMKSDAPCEVLENGNFVLGRGNSGSKLIATSQSTPTGTLNFTLQCSPQTGGQLQENASASVK